MRVAITGFGCVSGYGMGRDVLMDGWLSGIHAGGNGGQRSTACAPAREALPGGQTQGASAPPRTSLMARAAAAEAWSGSGLAGRIAPERAGLMMNRNFGQHAIVSRYYETLWEQGPSGVSGFSFVQTIANSVLGAIAIEHQLRGPSVLVFGSSLLATAVDLLREGSADALLVGAVDELSELAVAISDAYGLTLHARGAAATRAYGEQATGFLPGDGAAFLVLEEESHARGRSAHVLAYLCGCGASLSLGDAGDPLRREVSEVSFAIVDALSDAGVDAASIDVAVTAAAGLPACDEAELQALTMLGMLPPSFALKAALGETWSVSALFGVAAAALMLRAGVVMPTPAFASRGLPLFERPAARDAMRFAAVTSMDPSGANDAFVLERAP